MQETGRILVPWELLTTKTLPQKKRSCLAGKNISILNDNVQIPEDRLRNTQHQTVKLQTALFSQSRNTYKTSNKWNLENLLVQTTPPWSSLHKRDTVLEPSGCIRWCECGTPWQSQMTLQPSLTSARKETGQCATPIASNAFVRILLDRLLDDVEDVLLESQWVSPVTSNDWDDLLRKASPEKISRTAATTLHHLLGP